MLNVRENLFIFSTIKTWPIQFYAIALKSKGTWLDSVFKRSTRPTRYLDHTYQTKILQNFGITLRDIDDKEENGALN